MDFICCMRMPQHRQPPLSLETRKQRVHRKLSLRQQQIHDPDEVAEQQGLKTIGQYIQTNIQSKRKNIIQLYSTTISFLQHSEKPPTNDFVCSPTSKKMHKRRSNVDCLEPLSPLLGHKSSNLDPKEEESSMIVSNKFSQKRPNTKLFLQKLCFKQTENKRSYHSNSSRVAADNSPKKQVKKIQFPVMRNIKSRGPKKLKNNIQSPNEINPWEYLVIAQDPNFFNS